MASQIRVEQITSSIAALDLLVMGLSALIAPRQRRSLDHAVPQSSQANLSRRLMQREIALHQRSGAETLLKAFTRAQMTPHYWGELAGSLQDLGLSSGLQYQAKVDRDAVRTRLWLEPHHGTEAYLVEVARSGDRVIGCGCTIAVGTVREQVMPRQGIVRMVGNASL